MTTLKKVDLQSASEEALPVDSYAQWLYTVLGEGIIANPAAIAVIEDGQDLSLEIPREYLQPCLLFLRDHSNSLYKTLVDIVAVDYPQDEKRFEVNYLLLSIQCNHRLRVKVSLDAMDSLPSVTGIYRSANWFEREVWDMFGIYFEDHPDLRRLLTDYGFQGHPLRKDFPVVGFNEVRYDEEKKRVVCEPLEFSQEYRKFHFQSPWQQNPEPSLLLGTVEEGENK